MVTAKRRAEADALKAEAASEKLQRDNGDVFECQCCFDEFTINKITHCDGDTIHYFCLDCAKRNANNEIGKMRYKLICMSGDVCAASFSRSERNRFLDENALKALDRLQLQAEVKEAGVDIVWCPFCDFGATCPPLQLDREFRCQGTDCGKISCRICKMESHVPLSCEDSKKENQLSERHLLEEARTAALLKKCPKCNVPILKDQGCNRLMCTCGGIMCDFCGMDITDVGYGHFRRDEGRNSKDKGCPTYDDSNARLRNAVKTAEADALKEARARNPELSPDALKIKFDDDAPAVAKKPAGNNRGRDYLPETALERAYRYREEARWLEILRRETLGPIPLPDPQLRQLVRAGGSIGYNDGYGGFGTQQERPLQHPVQPPVTRAVQPSVARPVQPPTTRPVQPPVTRPVQPQVAHPVHAAVAPPPQLFQPHQTLQRPHSVVPPTNDFSQPHHTRQRPPSVVLPTPHLAQLHQTHRGSQSIVPPTAHLSQPHQARQRPDSVVPSGTLPPAQFTAAAAANLAYSHPSRLPAYTPMLRQPAQFVAATANPTYPHPSYMPAYGPMAALPDFYHPWQPTPRPNIEEEMTEDWIFKL